MVAIFRTSSGNPSNYFSLQRTFFKAMGISFDQTETKSYKVYSTVFLFFTVCTYPLIQLSDVFKFYDDIEKLSDILTFTSLVVMGLAKSMVLYRNRKNIGKTLDMFEEGVFVPNVQDGGDEEIVWVKKCILTVNRQCIFYLGSVYITMVAGITDCAHRRLTSSDYHDWKFPMGSFSLFDVTFSPNYEIACFYQIFCVAVCFTMVILSDVLISGILAHIATQFIMLQDRIRRMTANAHRRAMKNSAKTIDFDPSKISWAHLERVLKETVVYHMKIIELAEKFERQFSYLVLVQFLTTSCTLCFTMYYCSTLSITDFKFIQYIVGGIDIALQVLFYCYWGNEVTIESQAIVEACYSSNFVGADLRFQEGLIMMMKRGQKPIILTAGKFAGLSLNTYVWIIRASYSYYMVLNRR